MTEYFVDPKPPSYLRLHRPEPDEAPAEQASSVERIRRAFNTAFGLEYAKLAAPHSPGSQSPVDRLTRPGPKRNPAAFNIPRADVEVLAAALHSLEQEHEQLTRKVERREAELAVGVPLVIRPRDEVHLAQRMQAVLRAAAEAFGCYAAALYLLDDATTTLKLRACWGLPSTRLLDAPRPLEGAVADLEAISGHAVVLEDDQLFDYWNVPERGSAAVCVPVASANMQLGTMWLFSQTPRTFSDRETNLIEVIAGRLTAELEREILLGERNESASRQQKFSAAVKLHPPSLSGWQIDGATAGNKAISFHDWHAAGDGCVVVVGGGQANSETGAATGVAVRSLLRAHAKYSQKPGDLLERAGLELWRMSGGGQFASAMVAAVEPSTHRLSIACSGDALAIHVTASRDCEIIRGESVLGLIPDERRQDRSLVLAPGDLLVAICQSDIQQLDEFGYETLAALATDLREADPATLAKEMAQLLHADNDGAPSRDASVVVIRPGAR